MTGYQNTRNELEIEDMDPYDIANELNLTCATVSLVIMKEKEEIRVLIDNIQYIELGLCHVTINTDNILS